MNHPKTRVSPIVACLSLLASSAMAEQTTSTYSIFGMPGVLTTPTAQMAEESELSVSHTRFGPHAGTSIGFQLLKNLSVGVHDSEIKNFTQPAGSDVLDRRLAIQFQLLSETKNRPALAIGVTDSTGQGPLASEFIVATKSFGEKFALSGGIGWGRLGQLDPVLNKDSTNEAGLFNGPAAPFLGATYKVNDKLTLKAEYSPDNFASEVASGEMTHDTPLNFGIDYEIAHALHLNAFYLNGTTFGAGINIRLNPQRPQAISGRESAPLPVKPRPSKSNQSAWKTDWVNDPSNEAGIKRAMATALKKDGIYLKSLALGATHVVTKVENRKFHAPAQAIGRTARTLTRALPPSVEIIEIQLVENGIPLNQVTLKRSDIERLEHANADKMLARATIKAAPPQPVKNAELPKANQRFGWALTPYIDLSVFDSNSATRSDIGLHLSGKYRITPNVIFSGTLQKSIWGNLDDNNDTSETARYAREGDPAIRELSASWYSRPGTNLFGRVTSGYFEKMYGGIAAELLWKPVDSPLAIGGEIAWLKKRDYDQMLGFQGDDIATGHVSAYYDFGSGFSTQLDVGRYIGGDYGATASLYRTFSNGWKIGGYVTKTDGVVGNENDIDQGVSIIVPLEWALGTPSRSTMTTDLRSLDRKTGRRLELDGRLFDWVDDSDQIAIEQSWGKFWR